MRYAAFILAALALAGIGVGGFALAAGSGEHVVCATATVPAQTVAANGAPIGTIPAAGDVQCVTATDQTVTQTVTVNGTTSVTSTTVPTTTTQPTTTAPPPSGPCGTNTGTPAINKVVWIWMENHDYSQIVGNSAAPYENQLAAQCGLATNYAGVTHPSLPNYIAGTSGSTQGITDDAPPSSHVLNVPSIFGQVTSKSYQESMSSNCLLSDSGNYAVKHNPEAYYTPVRTACNSNDVPMGTTTAGAFLSDLNAGNLPAFSFVTPNLCNDMHDCSVATGDAWLASWVPKILASSDYTSGHLAVFVVFDENDGSTGNHVYASVASPYTTVGARSGTAFSHYSLLRTAEEILGQPLLGNSGSANSMAGAFNLGGQTPPPPPPSGCTKTLAAGGSVQSFAASLVAGDVGCVSAGTYTGNVTLHNGGATGNPIALQPVPGASVTINGFFDLDTGTPNWRVTGFKIDGSGSTGQTVRVYSDNIRIDHNEIVNGHKGASCVIVGYLQQANMNAHNDEIDHNRIHACGTNSSPYGHGVYLCCGFLNSVHDNTVYDTTGFGVQLYPQADGSVVSHNVFDGSSLNSGVLFGGDPYVGCDQTDNTSLTGNVFSNNHGYGLAHFWGCTPNGSGNDANGNCFYANGSGDHDSLTGYTVEVSVDALSDPYTNRAGGDFSIQPASPCFGMGPR